MVETLRVQFARQGPYSDVSGGVLLGGAYMIAQDGATTVYIVEYPDGLCRFHLYSKEEMSCLGGKAGLESRLCAEFVWFEQLGAVFPRPDGTFAESDFDKLLLRSSKRLVLISDWSAREYQAMEWSDQPLM